MKMKLPKMTKGQIAEVLGDGREKAQKAQKGEALKTGWWCAVTSLEMEIVQLRRAIERAETARLRIIADLIANLQKEAGQRAELAKQEAIAAGRKAGASSRTPKEGA